jgi:TrfB plasmid transcriptional repressor
MTATVDLELLERIATQRKFEPQTLEIAKRLLLYGEKPKRLAAEFGVNHQRVYAIRKEVVAAVKELALPAGWEEVTLAGPQPVIAALKAQLEQALAQYGPAGRREVKAG